jgi:hypothetical protein
MNDLPSPPQSIWDVNVQLQFDEPLPPGDPRWVDTAPGRGEFSLDRLYRMLGVDPNTWTLKGAPSHAYVLFCGHRGCGKSTELRRAHERLNEPDIFFSVLLDAAADLDPNNLQYQDVLLGLAKALLEALPDTVEIDAVHLRKLEDWFTQRVRTHEASKEFRAEIETGLEAGVSIPLLSKLFAKLTAAIKTNSTYKDELRTVVRNTFSDFADGFNRLIKAVEQACAKAGLGSRVLFIVDGTDRLRGDDADCFFVRDVYQLQLIDSLFIYASPIHLLHSGSAVHQSFTGAFRLPMIKLYERDGTTRYEPGFEVMRTLLFRRARRELFDSDDTVELLVETSGGHPRDLLRLLQYTFESATGDVFDRPAAERAVRSLATDYRIFLEATDYALLRQIDANPAQEHNSERIRYLLYNLAVLEYNSTGGAATRPSDASTATSRPARRRRSRHEQEVCQ